MRTPEAKALTPKQVSLLLGKRKYEIALKFGVTSRYQVYKVLTGKSNNPDLLLALYAELQRVLEARKQMGITNSSTKKRPPKSDFSN